MSIENVVPGPDENIETLGGLVEFLNYISVVDPVTKMVTAYCSSYPEIVAVDKDENVAVEKVKTILAARPIE